jgi:hypothetical protein
VVSAWEDEIGAISSRGVLRLRPGSHAGAGRAPAAEPDEVPREGCWAQLPLELLRMVLVRVEDQEPRWPGRSAVVACACVCRCWRAAVKEIVRVPEASGKLTFPISLKQVCFGSLSPTLNPNKKLRFCHSHILLLCYLCVYDLFGSEILFIDLFGFY